MRVRWQGICLGAVLLGSFASLVHAANPEDEYRKLIRVNETIQPLGEHPFGENISLYDGSLSFTQTDISLQGDGPALQLIRHFDVYGNSPMYGAAEPAFGDWELEVPHLETLTAGTQPTPSNPIGIRMWDVSASGQAQAINGWQTDNTGGTSGNPNADVNARCSNFTAPPSVVSHLGDPALQFWDPEDWWKGYHLITPGESGQDILANTDASSKGTYPAVTKAHWRFSCLPTTANGQPGEGFLGQAPDGTQYWFDYLVYRGAEGMSRQLGSSVAGLRSSQSPLQRYVNATVEGMISLLSGSSVAHAAPTTDNIARSLGVLLVTKVQDRFGNTLNYSYDSNGYLTGISASDGRALSVVYVPGTSHIQSVTLQPGSGAPRTWVYTYGADGNSLVDVQLPDGSHWHYDISALQSTILRGGSAFSSCVTLRVPSSLGPITGTITHPSGLVGQFTVQGMMHGRSYVPQSCLGMQSGDPNTGGSYAVFPEAWYSLTTTQVVFSGAGLPTSNWSYNYSPPNESWSTCTGNCPTTIWTDVVDPNGSTTRHIFSNRFDISESQLVRTEFYAGAAGTSTLLRSEDSGYAPPTTSPLPVSAGDSLIGNVNVAQMTKYSPLNLRTITQDGQHYTWQATAFDVHAWPTDVKRYNDIAGQTPIEESITYFDDTSLWILRLPLTVTNAVTGEVETSNTYNSLDELTARARFGQTLMSYTWNSAGQLGSFTDGNGHTTALGNYYRGVPRLIDYPDGTSETLGVDDLGQITAITDQSGHTTSYSYDPVGRIAQITYPYDSSIDSAQWYPKVFTYAYVTSAERGLAANHWRRTVTQGSSTDTTYFDAELRPVLNDTSTGSASISTATGYDWRGLTTFAAYPLAGSPDLSAITTGTHSSYDALGRLTQTQQDSELGTLTTTTVYLPGPGTQVTDPKLNVTTTYDQAFDQPVYNVPWSISAPNGLSQSITRNIYGEPTAITQSGNYGTETDSVTKSLYYDSYHRLCRTTEPETGSTVMTYDAANNLAWSAEGLSITENGCGQDQVAAAAQTVRSYDAMNRVLTIAPPAGTQSTVYTYDALGHVRTAVSGVATQGYAYNSLGLLTGESLQVSGFSWALGYGYDAYGHRATVSYPAGAGTSEVVNYAPDAWGRPMQVGSYATGVGYFPNGQVEGFTYGNGRSYLAQQNARQLTSNFTDGVGSALDLSEDLTYDADGNITSVNDLTGGLRSKSFGYDALNRLTSASAPNLYGTENYTYDPINNLRTRLTAGQTLAYNYDATNKLTTITQGASTINSFLYNPQGDVIARGNTTLAFDGKHQLASLPGVESYSYDAAGRRVVKQPISGAPTYYFYDQAGQLMYQYAPGAATTTNYIYLGTHLIARHDQTQPSQPGAISFGANPNAGSTTVAWGSALAATSYTLQQSGDGGGTWSTIYGGSATSTTVSGLAGGGYVYRVQACIGSNCSGWTTSATLGVWPAIPVVTVPVGTVNGPYTVSWTAPVGATGYAVQESLNGGAWSTIATNITATSISRPGTTTGSYTYQVESSDAYGTAGWSATSATVSVNTNFGVVPSPVPTLSVPAASSTGSATVSWTAASPVTSYSLQQSNDGGSTWATVYSGTATSTTLTGLANGSYTYHVQACNDTAGNSVCTAWATGSALVVTLPPTSTPGLSAPASNGTGSYTVSWGSVATATSYTLQISSNGGGTWSTAYNGSATSWSASGQGNGSYTYRAQGCNVGGCGPWSGAGTTTVLLPPASAPGLSVPGSSATGSYTVSWSGVATATSYVLQISFDSGGWSTVQSSGATGWAASGQATGTYAYQVQACNASGCGPWSSAGTISVLLPPGSAPSLSVPSNNNTGAYTVSWGWVATAASYNLQESANGGGWNTMQAGSATSWNASGRTTGTYAYRVQACNASGCGPWSGSASVSVLLAPTTPTGLSATLYATTDPTLRPSTRYSLTASWPAVVGAASYNFQNCQPNGVCSTTTTTATSIPEFLVGGATVSVALQACNAIGCSPWSASQAPTRVNQ
ncbi:MAG TPA: hypothetical protein VGU65_07070 [Frateuria sp.]|uniref:hypothetical protein n=1 Tax=Frateuria sp. TaxID=2211372 RepID=UPI002DF1B9E8|nr:hypothetical protein [Frateuria sp.]